MSSPATFLLVEPFDAYLRRRARSAVAFTAGEAVTAAIALLRGCRGATGRFAGTRWWLRADGCPVAEEEEGGPDAIAATAETLERIATITDDDTTRDMLTRARESVLTLPPREWDAVERRLFQHAFPIPLVLGPLTPVAEAPPAPARQVTKGAPSRMLELVDADLADAVHEVLRDVRARWRSSPAVRFGALCTAGAVIVVTALLAWPTHDGPAASAPEPSVARAAGGSPSANAPSALAPSTDEQPASVAPTVTPPSLPPDEAVSEPEQQRQASPSSPGEFVGTARDLFAEIDRCDGDAACVASYEEDSGFPREPLIAGADDADIHLIDDFGGVVVVGLSVDSTTQYVTLVRQEDRWLVRAVRTVADQPS
ncbi:hypothetical protein [Microbacterium proteolyticum]|uniref:hypothetical protein n=1 Tax=Microbacterium proteolyticum TaxID=1572644 RepID=UPI001FAD493A|nr:hypothetical protein [Microbacterium proteolyticum]MCI9858456.1 hypothetical protein [Microbacterium proteolyticum]